MIDYGIMTFLFIFFGIDIWDFFSPSFFFFIKRRGLPKQLETIPKFLLQTACLDDVHL